MKYSVESANGSKGFMDKILTYGTFDLFHIGHWRLLNRAKALGDYLVIGLSTDEFNKIKGKKALIEYEERKQILESISFVNLVIPENNWEQKSGDIINNSISKLVMGDDWQGKFDHLKNYCEVIYLPRTRKISSTSIREIIHEDFI